MKHIRSHFLCKYSCWAKLLQLHVNFDHVGHSVGHAVSGCARNVGLRLFVLQRHAIGCGHGVPDGVSIMTLVFHWFKITDRTIMLVYTQSSVFSLLTFRE